MTKVKLSISHRYAALALHASILTVVPLHGAGAQRVTTLPPVDSSIVRRLEALSAPPYQASWRSSSGIIRSGRERVAVLISSRDCIGGRDQRFKPAVRAALRLLAQQAGRDGVGFSATGVAIDWEPDSGATYLKQLADFDQWVVGRNWLNDDVVQLVWQDSSAVPGIPQLLVYEREITNQAPTPGGAGGRLAFGPGRTVHRFVGPIQLANWVLAAADSAKAP